MTDLGKVKSVYTKTYQMVTDTKTKLAKVGSRHTIYLKKSFVQDKAFPFKPGEAIMIRIENNRLVIEKVN
jgi:hypothetical protein